MAEVTYFFLGEPGDFLVNFIRSDCGPPATQRLFLFFLLTLLTLAPPSWHSRACRFVSKIVSKTLSQPPEDAGLSVEPAPGGWLPVPAVPNFG